MARIYSSRYHQMRLGNARRGSISVWGKRPFRFRVAHVSLIFAGLLLAVIWNQDRMMDASFASSSYYLVAANASSFSSSSSSSSVEKQQQVVCQDPNALIHNHTTLLTKRPTCGKIKVAYAISLIKCGDFQSTPAGLVDAALVMRHAIHQTSSRAGVSNYDYKMYALVHPDAVPCSHIIKEAGYEVLIKKRPVEKSEIRGEFLRKHIHKEWCCGHDEFIKLFAYTLPEPIVVHVDIDFVFKTPMDDVFDALLYRKDSDIGKSARERIARERPADAWPDVPQAMMTRDWGQVLPGRKAMFQAGFIVARPNPQVMKDIVEIIREGHYEQNFSPQNGWGAKGYGIVVGAMAMQGLLAYYYDIHAPETWVELNQCRYNHMGMDVLFNEGGPGFKPRHKSVGKCRNQAESCEDCRNTPLDQIYNIHYTQCRKPWMCIGEGDSRLEKVKGKLVKHSREDKNLIPEQNVHLDHCMELLNVWHDHRSDLERQLTAKLTNDERSRDMVSRGEAGGYKKEFFHGHCTANGVYLTLANGDKETLKHISELYGDDTDTKTL